jgi:2-keto-3-deoxy-L-rhamnonate aldolase RhmA
MRARIRFELKGMLLFLVFIFPMPMRAQSEWKNPVKEALRNGEPVIGATITIGHPEVAMTMASAGYDFFWFEMEHSPITLENLRDMILAMRGFKTVPLVRIPINERWLVKRVLDIGCLGIIFPNVSTPALAEQAVKACKYPPAGVRGFGPMMAMSRWPVDRRNYPQWADDNIVVVALIEDKEGIDNIDAIAAVPGIDVLFIGPSDLSFSLGLRGNTQHPLVQEAIRKVVEAGKKHHVALGFNGGTPEEINRLVKEGYQMFHAPGDTSLLRSGADSLLSRIERR